MIPRFHTPLKECQIAFTVVLKATWFFVAIINFSHFIDEEQCLQGWNLLDFANFVLILIYTLIYAFVLSLFLLVSLICLPFWLPTFYFHCS